MIEEYIGYWGFTQHPFLLAPDSKMMCVTGQYYECLERVKYAIDSGKGGVLIVSEDAGLGKTTLLLKLIDDMKEKFGDAFRYAFIDHPTLNASQMLAEITRQISGLPVDEDKLKNLTLLKDTLIRAREQGGKSIIIVDEGQMLCGAPDILQELRALINLTHNSEYLHTFILSGQRALWYTIKNMPEFWQRLPVRYYFSPLKIEETRELVRYRLGKAGLVEGREIFSGDALDIIHRYSRGSPRTVIALADLSLLVGFTNQAGVVGFKEVSKAIVAMSGQGESLPYVRDEREPDKGPALAAVSTVERSADRPWRQVGYPENSLKVTPAVERDVKPAYLRPGFIILAVLAVILGGLGSYYYTSGSAARRNALLLDPPGKETFRSPSPAEGTEPPGKETLQSPAPAERTPTPLESKITAPMRAESPGATERRAANMGGNVPERTATVLSEMGNIRSDPSLDSPRIGMIAKDETIKVIGEERDNEGGIWYKVKVYGDRVGWISERIAEVRPTGGQRSSP